MVAVVIVAAEVGGLAGAEPLPSVVVFGIVVVVFELFHVLLLVRIASALVGPHHLVVFDVVRQIDLFTFFIFSPLIFLLYITPASVPSIMALFFVLFLFRELIIAVLPFTIFHFIIVFSLFLDLDCYP
jgi:hypothetical protein